MNPHSTELPTGTRIVLKDISMVYESLNGQIEALKKINLTVSENEFVAIVGPSGCGKTTLLRIAAQLIKPTRGQLFINGLNTEGTKHNLDIGYVFQDAALLDWRTVLQNVMLPIELAGNAGEDANTIALELIELVGLSGFATSYPYQLSGGMRQRVSIARALSLRPKLLLMDEPFAALDEFTRERLNTELLRILVNHKATVLFVTHNIAEAVYLADRVIVLSERPAQILANIPVPFERPRSSGLRKNQHFHEIIDEARSFTNHNQAKQQ